VKRLLLLAVLLLGFPLRAAAQPAETVEYYGQDMIGSIRIVWDASGNIVGRQDYAPFGRSLFPVPQMPKEGFGAREKNDETEQGYFHARMFEERTGRFTAPDPIGAGLFMPQRWNRYAYALNNPVTMVDFNGLSARNPALCTADIRATNPHDWHCESDSGSTAGPLFTGATGPRTGGGHGLRGREGTRTGTRGTEGSDNGSGTGQPPAGNAPPTRDGDGDGADNDPPTVPEACAQGLSGFVDGVVPFADPFKALGVYDDDTPGLSFSNSMGEAVRDFAAAEFSAGFAAARLALTAASRAVKGNSWYRLGNNPYARLGKTYMGGPGKTPALRFGNATSPLGKFVTHIDLRLTKPLSPATVKFIKSCK
jgi:RHS repeat-associated protein